MTEAPLADAVASLSDGTRVVARPLRPEDAAQIRDGFEHLSSESRHRRFLGVLKQLPPAHEWTITHLDQHDHLAWGVAIEEGGREIGVGIGHVVRDQGRPDHGEFAIVIADEWQKKGVGKVLTRALAIRSREVGIPFWTAVMFLDNRPVQRVLECVGEEIGRRTLSPGIGEIEYRLKESA